MPSEYTWHVQRVHKRVLKLVNFEVQKVQKPDLFDLAATSPRLRGDQGLLGRVSHTGANFTTKETRGATCALQASVLMRQLLVAQTTAIATELSVIIKNKKSSLVSICKSRVLSLTSSE